MFTGRATVAHVASHQSVEVLLCKFKPCLDAIAIGEEEDNKEKKKGVVQEARHYVSVEVLRWCCC